MLRVLISLRVLSLGGLQAAVELDGSSFILDPLDYTRLDLCIPSSFRFPQNTLTSDRPMMT
jgi:hypothetical protein